MTKMELQLLQCHMVFIVRMRLRVKEESLLLSNAESQLDQ